MPKINHLVSIDPTLEACFKALEQESANEEPRSYVGASGLGHECDRNIWYTHRAASTQEAFRARTLLLFADGHRSEDAMAALLRKAPGIQLWTKDESTGKQWGFSAHNRHMRGNLDGVIQGLIQAPTMPHAWEHKSSAKIGEFRNAKQAHGEKGALKAWDFTYYAQAQLYMHGMHLTRHYLTVSSPGLREVESCRTEYDPVVAAQLIARAEQIIQADEAPRRVNERPEFYKCKWCVHGKTCHEIMPPRVVCTTCAHATAKLEGPDRWWCEKHNRAARDVCYGHRFNPTMMAPATWEGTDGELGVEAVRYRMPRGKVIWNSERKEPDHYTSFQLRELLKDGNAAEGLLSDPGVAEIVARFVHTDPPEAPLALDRHGNARG